MDDNSIEKTKFNVYAAVTSSVIDAVQKGAGTFVMPWHSAAGTGCPRNASTDASYRGINIVALWVSATVRAYPSGYWASFRQWQRLGAHIRKGERGAIVVFYKEYPAPDDAEDDRPRLFARASTVFNAAQVEGWRPPEEEHRSEAAHLESIEAFVAGTQATIHHGTEVAQYDYDSDVIDMPDIGRFRGSPTSSATEAYYSTLLHELTHWSGATHRLDRKFGDRFGNEAYAFEELVAELGAAFLCAALGITNQPRPDHAAYIAHWLSILNRDTKAIFTAANQAQKAVEFLAKTAALKLKDEAEVSSILS